MLPEQITDPNIFRCAFKKGNAVIAKHLLLACYLIDAIAGIGIAYLGITKLLLPNALIVFGYTESYLGSYLGYVIGILLSIAWYWYVIAAIVIAYYGYGLLWCIARDLTKEDWKSNSANNFAIVLAILALTLSLTVVSPLSFILTILIFCIIVIVLLEATDPVEEENITVWYYVFRFFGAAWHHYMKRN